MTFYLKAPIMLYRLIVCDNLLFVGLTDLCNRSVITEIQNEVSVVGNNWIKTYLKLKKIKKNKRITYTFGICILSTSLCRLQSGQERERDEFRCALPGDMLDFECSPPDVGVRLPSSLPPWALLWCCCSDDGCSMAGSPISPGYSV